MGNESRLEAIRRQADDALHKLHGKVTEFEIQNAKGLVEDLRNAREYEPMGRLAEAISRLDPKDPKNRRLYAQYLIETGRATAAADVLKRLAQRLTKDHPEAAEATGLLGRAYKQIFCDAGDKTSQEARDALKRAIQAYRKPFEENRANTWHGVNLVALLTRARSLKFRMAPDLDPKVVAQHVVKSLKAMPENKRDEWYWPTLAEASLGLGEWSEVERNVHAYAANENAKAFLIASTLRQFEQIWDLGKTDSRGQGLLNILRARLASLPGGDQEFPPGELRRLQAASPDHGQLEAVLGSRGPETFRWWKTGLDRASAVGAVRRRLGGRIGTGFAVRATDFGLRLAEDMLLITNFHVVNKHGASPGIRPEDAEVVFEAPDPPRTHPVKQIVWSSPIDRHDATILRLEGSIADIDPLPLARKLPTLEEGARVYIIGHPGGRDLAFSFQDNELLDHEGLPAGNPQIPGVCRVHYRAPTEGGSSGSPVFNSGLWEVIALHHSGGRAGMPKLNGKDGTYAANEGIGMDTIRQAAGSALPGVE